MSDSGSDNRPAASSCCLSRGCRRRSAIACVACVALRPLNQSRATHFRHISELVCCLCSLRASLVGESWVVLQVQVQLYAQADWNMFRLPSESKAEA
eukprot:393785-Prymnesium_polylepis.1